MSAGRRRLRRRALAVAGAGPDRQHPHLAPVGWEFRAFVPGLPAGNWMPFDHDEQHRIAPEDRAGTADTKGTRHVVAVMIGKERWFFMVRAMGGRPIVSIEASGASSSGRAGVAGTEATSRGMATRIVDVPGAVPVHCRSN